MAWKNKDHTTIQSDNCILAENVTESYDSCLTKGFRIPVRIQTYKSLKCWFDALTTELQEIIVS